MTESTVTFKKRSVKNKSSGKSRNTTTYDDEDDQIDQEMLNEIKEQQSIRSRKVGSSVEILNKKERVLKGEETTKTIESTMSSQYTIKIDNGMSSNSVPHENIMEQYVNEKLGLKKESEPEIKVVNEEDELYRVPDQYKAKSLLADKKKSKEDAEGVITTWSTGIAEVALPISFKMKNIERTEKAAKNLTNQPNPLPSQPKESSSWHQRFQVHDHNFQSNFEAYVHQELEKFTEEELTNEKQKAILSAAIEKNKEDKSAEKVKRPQRTDDAVMENFRKRIRK